jgi:hypothetical protein
VITDDQPGTTSFADQTVLYTFTFSEAVSLFDRSDITVSGASFTAPGTFTAVSATVYTLALDLAPSAGTAGTLGVSVAAGAAINGSAIGNAGPVSATQAFDLQRPTLAITDTVTGTTSGPITFTFTTSEAVTGFDTSDVTVSGGSITTPFAGSGSVYTMTVTPAAGVASGTVSVSVGASAFTDTAGNTNTVGASGLQAIDTVEPGVSAAAVTTTPGGVAVANNGSTTDTTPRLTITLDSALLLGETVALSRTGSVSAVATFTSAAGSSLVYDSTLLAPGTYDFSATFTNGSNTTSTLDLDLGTAGTTYRITIL